MDLNLLDDSVGAELSERRPAVLRNVQGGGLGALLAGQGLLETPCGRPQIYGAVLRDGDVPGEAVERHREGEIQFGNGEDGRRARRQILAGCREKNKAGLRVLTTGTANVVLSEDMYSN